ncbi:formate dehydrogenase family accessory protein FdhD, partial [Candidatus Bathyarchaeota archaeon CG07_land_8_20_14_0_80_47_9]
VAAGRTEKKTDYVAEEKPLHLFLNRTQYATIFCSPSNLKELAIGHVISEGIIKSVEEIERTSLKDEVCRIYLKDDVDIEKRLRVSQRFSRVILSACGSESPFLPQPHLARIRSDLRVRAEIILDAIHNLDSTAETYRKTGGVHAAAIFKSDGTVVAFAEDVGRHNAVDKVIGITSLVKTDLDHCFLALSGRLTSDIVFKAARVRIPIIASLAAAIDSGIEVAKRANLTLIGFVRGRRMNIYAFPERIVL